MKKILLGFMMIIMGLAATGGAILHNEVVETNAAVQPTEIEMTQATYGTKRNVVHDFTKENTSDYAYLMREGSLIMNIGKGGYVTESTLITKTFPIISRDSDIGLNFSFSVPEGKDVKSLNIRLALGTLGNTGYNYTHTFETPVTGDVVLNLILPFDYETSNLEEIVGYSSSLVVHTIKDSTDTLVRDLVYNYATFSYYELVATKIEVTQDEIINNVVGQDINVKAISITTSFEGGYQETISKTATSSSYYLSNNIGNFWHSETYTGNVYLSNHIVGTYFGLPNYWMRYVPGYSAIKLTVGDVYGYILHEDTAGESLTPTLDLKNGDHVYIGGPEGYLSASNVFAGNANVLISESELTSNDLFMLTYSPDSKIQNLTLKHAVYGYLGYYRWDNIMAFFDNHDEFADEYAGLGFAYIEAFDKVMLINGYTDTVDYVGGQWNEYYDNEDVPAPLTGNMGLIKATPSAATVANLINAEDSEGQCVLKFNLAKKSLLALSIEELNVFKTSTDTNILNARLRYEAWAAHLNQSAYTDEVLINDFVVIQDISTILAVVSIIVIASVSLIAYTTYSKKRLDK